MPRNKIIVIIIATTVIVSVSVSVSIIYLLKNSEKSFVKYVQTDQPYPVNKSANYERIFSGLGLLHPCSSYPDEPCGFNIYILGDKNWAEKKGIQTFYLEFADGLGSRYYGPFTDNLQRIIEEAKEEVEKLG